MVNSWRKYICLFFLFVVFDCWMSWNSPRRQEICEWHVCCCCCMNRISSLFFLSKTNVPFFVFHFFWFCRTVGLIPYPWYQSKFKRKPTSLSESLNPFLLIITAGEDSPINKISLTTPWAIFRYARSHNSASSWWFIGAISRIKLIKSVLSVVTSAITLKWRVTLVRFDDRSDASLCFPFSPNFVLFC